MRVDTLAHNTYILKSRRKWVSQGFCFSSPSCSAACGRSPTSIRVRRILPGFFAGMQPRWDSKPDSGWIRGWEFSSFPAEWTQKLLMADAVSRARCIHALAAEVPDEEEDAEAALPTDSMTRRRNKSRQHVRGRIRGPTIQGMKKRYSVLRSSAARNMCRSACRVSLRWRSRFRATSICRPQTSRCAQPSRPATGPIWRSRYSLSAEPTGRLFSSAEVIGNRELMLTPEGHPFWMRSVYAVGLDGRRR